MEVLSRRLHRLLAAANGAAPDFFETRIDRQGLTLVHFSAQPEPFLTRNTPQIPPNAA